ncbi:uncharacterized protein MJAP1_002042 [Malassezia japonica]|uniref:Uncharacterized protein n=1 Tax=Malassezia japonica TaxID=223818 RepID=A0AAF0J9S6_9BASI|nr:uncharacterized protein MJAP1_002042 [Malassezia japonica]WFD39072.1 hypothetical protein MJAP1_002042 [Malassezia japonica]
MPSSSFTSSEKSLIKSVLTSSSCKIITATLARIYVTYPTPDRWYYTGIEGALAFVRDADGNFGFRVVDLKDNGKVIWDHELYDDFYFYQDKPYFHTFAGDECMIGLCYADEAGAAQLYKKLNNRAKYAKSSSSSSGFGFAKKLTSKLDWSKSSSSEEKRAAKTSTPTQPVPDEPQWNGLVDQLGSMGVSQSDIQNNEGFIRDFLGQRANGDAPGLAPPVTETFPTLRNLPPPVPSVHATPPPPSPAPSAPPIPQRNVSDSVPPPPGPRPPRSVPAPPPRSGAGGGAPPPVPPPPSTRAAKGGPPPVPSRSTAGRAPPPVPPPPVRGGAPPPPPPPPSVGGEGRNALLASIQGKSVRDLKKTETHDTSSPKIGSGSSSAAAAAPAAGGNDLASALASALNQRKDNMGGSDDEESDEDW